jgi:hypothetical protein
MRFRIMDIFKWTAALAVVFTLGFSAIRLQSALALVLAVAFVFTFWGRLQTTWQQKDWTLFGMFAGVAAGLSAGITTDLGYRLAEHFEPREPAHFIAPLYGRVFGVILGAWFGALAGGIASMILRRRFTQQPASDNSDHS